MGGSFSKAIAKVLGKLFYWKMMGKSPEVCGKVHLLVQDFSKSMDDLPQVVNVVYDNFTSMSYAIDATFRDIDTKHIFYDNISEVIQKVQHLNGIIRWALKCCANDRGVIINMCFLDILMDVESYFAKASLFLTAAVQPSVPHTNDFNISSEFDYLVRSIQKAVLIFWESHEPSSVSVFGEDSVMESLDQATEDKNILQRHREHCIFLKKYIQFIREHMDRASWVYVYTCVEYILYMMSCFVFHYKFTKKSLKVTDRINGFIHHLILCILVQSSSSRPPFTDELLVAYIEFTQKILRWVPKISNHPNETYQDALSLLHSIVSYTPNHDIDRDVLFRIKVKVDTALRRLGYFVAWFFSGNFDGGSWQVEIFQPLLLPILHCDAFLSNEILIKYAYYFRHYWFQLPKNEDTEMKSPLEDQSRFDEDLVFVARVVFYEWSEHHIDQEILIKCKSEYVGVLRDLGCIISSSFNNEVAGNIAMAMNPGLPDLLTKVKNVKIQLAKTISPLFFKRLSLNYTETNLLGYLDIFYENLKEEICKYDLVMDWKHVLQTIQQDIICFRSFLHNIRENSFKDDRLRNISIRIRNAAYNAEYIINAFAAGTFHVSCRSVIISDLMEELNLIKELIIEHSRNALPLDSVLATNAKKDVILPSSRVAVPSIDVIVGFEAQIKLMMECLASDNKQLDVISIVGMPGIGKTTLAKKVYEKSRPVIHFDFRAWACVSQEYDKKELLLSILGIGVNDPEKSCQELSLMLHRELSGRRYLIVLDDVWDIDVFNEINRLFPKENYASRIVLTSRIKLTGIQVELSPLSDSESWTILKQKVFPEKECPLELFQIGKQIANKCGGLPLAVVVVAGILAKSDMAQDAWEEVAARLDIYSADESERERRMKALDLSYEVLPDHLKPLFLYVGAFPEDEIIPAKNLKWLWIAEGFIREETKTNKSLEDQAETYLMDLIDRSLIMVAERKSDGSVRTCRIHDLMRDMLLGKSKAENFMQHHNIEGVENLLNQHLTYPRRVSASVIRERHTQTPSTADEDLPVTCEDLRRISMSSHLTSLMLFDPQLDDGRRDHFYESIFQYHKVLRVFHAYGHIFGSIFTHETLPVNLRYISVENYMLGRIYSSVFRLWNLETLIITTLPRESIEVPVEVWKMAKLRHLHIGNWAIFSSKTADSGKLENLQTLSTPVFIGNFPKVIGKFPNLLKLKCNFSDGRRDISRLPKLDTLGCLESVKVLWNGRLPCSAAEFSLPITLRKLSLSWFRLKWKTISSFHKLPNLEILKLDFRAVDDEVWDTGDVEFPKLVFLELCDLNIKRWIASDKNFPRLHNLVLRYCDHLKEIPSDLGDVCKKFEVNHCSHNASNSAKRIRDEQMENGNRDLTVHISDPYPAQEDSDSEYSDPE